MLTFESILLNEINVKKITYHSKVNNWRQRFDTNNNINPRRNIWTKHSGSQVQIHGDLYDKSLASRCSEMFVPTGQG